MRLEATVPDSRGAAVKELAEQLGLTRSQIVDEALSLFLMAVMQFRQGRRFVSIGPTADDQTQLMTPTLAQLQWMFAQRSAGLGDEATGRMVDLIESPPEANEALRAALADKG